MASYYGDELAGNRTASGERFDPDELTAAHRTLAFGSRVRVTNLANGKSVIVRINDRGPFSRGRVIDVSDAAAREIDMRRSGVARVSMTLLDGESEQIGSASCRERVCQYVWISVVAVSLK